MKLLREISEEIELEESIKNDTKSYFIKGIFMQSEVKNGNGRIYPRKVMEKAANTYISESVNRGKAYGELDHPKGANVSLKNASHMITELKLDGNNYIGKAKIFEGTACGDTAIGLIKGGANLGVSSRALGSINETARGKIVENMHIITAGDIVADPSAPEAFMDALYENKEWVWDNGVVIEKIIQEELKTSVSLVERLARREKAFERFMAEIRNA